MQFQAPSEEQAVPAGLPLPGVDPVSFPGLGVGTAGVDTGGLLGVIGVTTGGSLEAAGWLVAAGLLSLAGVVMNTPPGSLPVEVGVLSGAGELTAGSLLA